MTRVIGGAARGQRLAVPAGARPTGDRAREALFSMVESVRGAWSGARVLDLYAGSGALGLEALSRGAAVVDLVESDRTAAKVVRANLGGVRRAGITATGTVHHATVERWLRGPARHPYDVAFCDPPYATPSEGIVETVVRLGANGWLAQGALVVLERSHRDPAWQWPKGFEALRDRRYGEAHLWLGQW